MHLWCACHREAHDVQLYASLVTTFSEVYKATKYIYQGLRCYFDICEKLKDKIEDSGSLPRINPAATFKPSKTQLDLAKLTQIKYSVKQY